MRSNKAKLQLKIDIHMYINSKHKNNELIRLSRRNINANRTRPKRF